MRTSATLASTWSAIRRIAPIGVLLIGVAFVIAYGFPGYMNFDAAEQLHQARRNVYDDWHPPLMARYWRVLDKLVRGPLLPLILQTALTFWGTNALLRRRFQPLTAALVTVAILWFPPVLAPMGPVWKDAQMVGFLLAGSTLLLAPSWRARIGGGLLLVFAAGVRDNAIAALPPFLLLAAWSWGYRRKLVVAGVAFAILFAIAGTAAVANRVIADRRAHAWAEANAIHDIAGMICLTDPMTDAEVRAALAGVSLRVETDIQKRFCEQYDPKWWLPLSLNANGLFHPAAPEAERRARRDAYFRLLRRDVLAFVEHRWRVMKELLGLGAEVPNEPVCQTFAGTDAQLAKVRITDNKHTAFQKLVGEQLVWFSTTLLFRPWAYLLFGLFLLAYGFYKRDGLVLAVLGSGLLYELSFVVGAAGNPYRYSHWMILCVCVATVLVFRARLTSGVSASSRSRQGSGRTAAGTSPRADDTPER